MYRASGVKNPYGFQNKKYSYLGLGRLIGMEKRSMKFQDIVKDMRNLRKKILNVKYCAMDQEPSLQLIETELKKRYPQVFEGNHGPKHLYFAMSVVMNLHSGARYRFERNLKPRRSIQINGTNIPRQNNRSSVASRNIQRAKIATPFFKETSIRILRPRRPRFVAYVLVPPRRYPEGNISVSRDTRPTKMAKATDLNDVCNSENISLHSVNGAPSLVMSSASGKTEPSPQYTCPGTPGPSHVEPRPAPSRGQVHSITLPPAECTTAIREAEIYTFLHTCQPPMMHYLRRFVDFGCMTSTHLRSVSLWRPTQRHNLLKKILTFGERGAVPSEMDIAVLENQLETYFLED